MISFFVEGVPAPQGSKDHVGNGRMVESSKRLKPWRATVRAAARAAWEGEPYAGPVSVDVTFRFLRPKSHYGTGRNAAILKGSAPSHHAYRPDVDKLARAILDALTGVAWSDDSQVVAVHACKRWTDGCEVPGALIRIVKERA